MTDRSKRVAVAGDLRTNSVDRHLRRKRGTNSVVANNAGSHFGHALNPGVDIGDETIASIDENYYRAGPRTSAGEAVTGTTDTDAKGPITAYIASHETDPSSIPVTGNGDGIRMVSRRPLRPDDLETVRGRQVYDAVLDVEVPAILIRDRSVATRSQPQRRTVSAFESVSRARSNGSLGETNSTDTPRGAGSDNSRFPPAEFYNRTLINRVVPSVTIIQM
ncbi:hypothetical protein C477_16930 [Haloterrigena salina JCM 13891]|uniref:Uncharacterized protein n=1 Tax=Haloterrigena salina JCM 13891 TaxID=1227488 RepID=M0BWI9_9EURY|nr:hypothetical protein [Haloterrigena salina]ELZ15391.1 hypothetical protein C477_16930 [Haloterrigena salina JCM 13891]